MKRTKIKYQNVGKDQIRVVGIENCADIGGIRDEFGNRVCNKYFNLEGNRYSILGVYKDYIWIQGKVGDEPYTLKINTQYSKQYFSDAIRWMRLAGERLGRIVKEEREREASQIKEIVI